MWIKIRLFGQLFWSFFKLILFILFVFYYFILVLSILDLRFKQKKIILQLLDVMSYTHALTFWGFLVVFCHYFWVHRFLVLLNWYFLLPTTSWIEGNLLFRLNDEFSKMTILTSTITDGILNVLYQNCLKSLILL